MNWIHKHIANYQRWSTANPYNSLALELVLIASVITIIGYLTTVIQAP